MHESIRSGLTRSDSSTGGPSQPEIVIDTVCPQAQSRNRLDVNRNDSILVVLDSPTESDYHQLRAQQLLQRNQEEAEKQKPVVVPVQPTCSVLSDLD